MRSNYDFLTGRIREVEEKNNLSKRLREDYERSMKAAELAKQQAEEEKKKQARKKEIVSIIEEVQYTTTYDFNDAINTLRHRVSELERTAADRSGFSNRPRKNLRITIRA